MTKRKDRKEKMKAFYVVLCAVCVACCALVPGCKKSAPEAAEEMKSSGEPGIAELQRQLDEALKR